APTRCSNEAPRVHTLLGGAATWPLAARAQLKACGTVCTSTPLGVTRYRRRGNLAALLRTVLSCPVDHLVGDRATERAARHGVAAIVNAGPDARLVGFLGERGKRGGITREQISEDGGRPGRKAAVRGWIAWMVRC